MFSLFRLWMVLYGLRRFVRLSYLPPLLIYFAAGSSALTAVASSFFVKDYLGLSAEFLASVAFWAIVPWMLKVPVGFACDVIGRWRGLFVVAGASLIAVSLTIMIGLFAHLPEMARVFPISGWYLAAVMCSTIGYALEDVVADGMTLEAVLVEDSLVYGNTGERLSGEGIIDCHHTAQTLGRAAVVAGGLLVGLANVMVFSNSSPVDPRELYIHIYHWAYLIPLVSLLGLVLEWVSLRRTTPRGRIEELLPIPSLDTVGGSGKVGESFDASIVGWSTILLSIAVAVGLSPIHEKEILVFSASLVITVILLARCIASFSASERAIFVGTALIVFLFRLSPGIGPGLIWWEIDELGFDKAFVARLMLVGSAVALATMFIYRVFLAGRSLGTIYGSISFLFALLTVPVIAMYYGFHEWAAAVTHGVINARVIALADVTLDAPLEQVAMIPALAWAGASAPADRKITFYGLVMSLLNLASSGSSILTKMLNHHFVVTRAVMDAGGHVVVAADYSHLGALMWISIVLGVVFPLGAIVINRLLGLRSWE